jgi:predicted alpha/beta superfamily hydrolase
MKLIVFLLLLLSCKALAQNPAVQLPNTTQLTIIQTVSGQHYQLYLYIPKGYAASTKKYGVLYVLDGQWNFATTVSLADGLYADGAIPNMIIAGITWPGEHPDYDSLRQAAFTPTSTSEVPYGGNASIFLKDIQKSIIPFIDSIYRTDTSNRTLIGGSLGTLFSAYVLLHATTLFNNYILASPALGYGRDTLLKLAKKIVALHNPLHAKVFIGAGDQDRFLPNTKQFIQTLQQAQLPLLQLYTQTFKNTGHANGIAEGISRGLRTIFAKTVIKLNAALLKEYTGNYARAKDDSFVLFFSNNNLMMQYDANTVFELHPETTTDFFINGTPLFFTFSKDEKGSVEGVTLKYPSGEAYYKKMGGIK